MIYSSGCQYAIRAMVYLAHHRDRACLSREVSQKTQIPYHFLAKILRELNRAGLLTSTRGRSGGVQLAKPPDQITLYDVKEAIDGVKDLEECAVGIRLCDNQTPCPIHDTFAPIHDSIRSYLKTITLETMVSSVNNKKTRPSRSRRAGKLRLKLAPED
jgi:Rrf2 family iron-sulfur cluster assembly transcriptional regulator